MYMKHIVICTGNTLFPLHRTGCFMHTKQPVTRTRNNVQPYRPSPAIFLGKTRIMRLLFKTIATKEIGNIVHILLAQRQLLTIEAIVTWLRKVLDSLGLGTCSLAQRQIVPQMTHTPGNPLLHLRTESPTLIQIFRQSQRVDCLSIQIFTSLTDSSKATQALLCPGTCGLITTRIKNIRKTVHDVLFLILQRLMTQRYTFILNYTN